MKTPSEELCKGRRAIDEIPQIEILDDWNWNKQEEKWILHLRISIPEIAESLVPSESDWFVVVTDRYPMGIIKFYPSVVTTELCYIIFG